MENFGIYQTPIIRNVEANLFTASELRNNLPTCDNDATSLYKENFRSEMLIYRSFKIQFL